MSEAMGYTREEIEQKRHEANLWRDNRNVWCVERDSWLATVDASDAEIWRLREALREAAETLRVSASYANGPDVMAGLRVLAKDAARVLAKIEAALGGEGGKP